MSDAGSGCEDGEDNGEKNNNQVDSNDISRAFDLLDSHRHRYVLEKLSETSDGVASVDDLVDYLLTHDPGTEDKDRAMASLHHQVLPKLDDTGIIDYDRRSETVRYRGDELVEDLLDTIEQEY